MDLVEAPAPPPQEDTENPLGDSTGGGAAKGDGPDANAAGSDGLYAKLVEAPTNWVSSAFLWLRKTTQEPDLTTVPAAGRVHVAPSDGVRDRVPGPGG